MNIQHISNLCWKTNNISKVTIKPVAPYLALAGNIGNVNNKEYTCFIDNVCRDYEKVFLVPGPKEYEHCNMQATKRYLKNLEVHNSNFHVLDNRSMLLDDDHIILGSTLWPNTNMMSFMYDEQLANIKDEFGNYLTSNKIKVMHLYCKDFIKREFQNAEQRGFKCIVVSHFNPVLEMNGEGNSYVSKAALSNYNSDLEDFFVDTPLIYWICGAMNTQSEMNINGIPLVCNNRV